MSKKILLPALLAVSAVMLAVPALAAAITPVHVTPLPANGSLISGGASVLSTVGGSKVTCEKVEGKVTSWESTTTGKLTLTFSGNCQGHVGFTAGCNPITTTELQFHLATLPNGSPGVLITGNNEHFASFSCAGIFNFKVTGNGVIGTITAPACGAESETATMKFESSAAGVQKHKLLAGTATVYNLKSNGEEAAMAGEGKITFTGKKKLDCT